MFTEMSSTVMHNPAVAALVRRFDEAGYELYLVGGSVRDMLLGQEPNDLDFTTNAGVDEFEGLLAGIGSVYAAGRQFGTLAVSFGDGEDDKIEITTFRTEIYVESSRKPEVGFAGGLREDLVRRDFTVNAMALNLLTSELFDPFGGRAALEAGSLVTPRDPVKTMVEDPLRMVRAVRFAATRRWTLESALEAAIVENRKRLEIVSRERITAEMMKIVKTGNSETRAAIEIARRCGIDKVIFGDFANAVSERVGGDDVATRFASMAHTAKLQDVVYQGRTLIMPLAMVKEAQAIMDCAHAMAQVSSVTEARRVARRFTTEVIGKAALMLNTVESDGCANGVNRVQMLLHREPHAQAPLPVDGNDALVAGLVGREIGEALREIEELRCTVANLSRDEAMAALLALAES